MYISNYDLEAALSGLAEKPNEEIKKISKNSVSNWNTTKVASMSETLTSHNANMEDKPLSFKQQQKLAIKKKFIVGRKYSLRTKVRDGSASIEKVYLLKKFVYAINDTPMNMLVVKQVSGPQGNIFTLNRNDCKVLHIKYEPGLEYQSMALNWKLVHDTRN